MMIFVISITIAVGFSLVMLHRGLIALPYGVGRFGIMTVAGVFFIALSTCLYLMLGAYPQWREYQFQQSHKQWLNKHVSYFRKHPKDLLATLKKKLAQDPNSARGWMLLGMVLNTQGQTQQAHDALEHALQLQPDNTTIIIRLAETNARINHGVWQQQDQVRLHKAMITEPNNPMVIHLLGVIAYQQHKYQQAILYWRQALRLLPEQSEASAVLTEAIAKAEQLQVPTTETDVSDKLTINVSVDKKLLSRYAGSTPVIVYVKAVNGPPMPLAVTKRTLSELPLQITLSDKDAMLPQLRLSRFKHVEVFARISQHGQALPEKGDAIVSKHVELAMNSTPIHLAITKIVS